MSASPELGGKCRALRGDRGKSAYTSQNHSFVSAHTCPFRRVTFPILSLFPVMQRRLFLFDPFLYFWFVSCKKTDFFFPGKIKWPAFASHFIKDIHIDITTPGRWVKGFVLSCCERHFCFCCMFCYFIFRIRCSLDEIGEFFSFLSHVGEYFCRIDTMLHDSSE